MSSIQKWGSYDIETADEEETSLKIIVAGRVFERAPYEHYVAVPGQGTGALFACPRRTAKRHCPVCAEARAEAR